MSYRISYEKKKGNRETTVCVCLGILCLLLCLGIQYLSIGRTGPILEGFAEDLKRGVPVGQAVESFCREWIHESPES